VGAVRLSPPVTILAIVAVAMAALAFDAPATRGYARNCAVLAEFNGIGRYNPKPDLFSGPPLAGPLTATRAKKMIQGFPKTDEARIAANLILRSVDEKPIDPVVACPEFAQRLKDLGIDFDRLAVAVALDYKRAQTKSPTRPIYVLAMRLPLISVDGKYAVVEMTYSSAVYQSGEMFLLRREQDGRWTEAVMLTSWMT
jgi:hypothetical protein